MHWTNIPAAGRLPFIFHDADPERAKEQIISRYAHGGGWHPFEGFTLHDSSRVGVATLAYPDDPDTREVSRATLHEGEENEELLILFEYSWIAVVRPDGTYEITRMD